VLELQLEQREPIDASEQLAVIRAHTAEADVVTTVLEELRLLRGATGSNR
jgi:hypothetical protein